MKCEKALQHLQKSSADACFSFRIDRRNYYQSEETAGGKCSADFSLVCRGSQLRRTSEHSALVVRTVIRFLLLDGDPLQEHTSTAFLLALTSFPSTFHHGLHYHRPPSKQAGTPERLLSSMKPMLIMRQLSRFQDCVEKLKDKLVEAAGVYRKDKETLDWHVMQDPKVSTAKLVAGERFLIRIWVVAGRDQVRHCRTLRTGVLAAIPLEQPLLEDLRPLRDAPAGQADGPDSMGGDVRRMQVTWRR
jgi:hypothetical protein